jgi:hypothetical protein
MGMNVQTAHPLPHPPPSKGSGVSLDPEYQKSLKRARKEIEAGRYIRDEDMWRDLINKEAKAGRPVRDLQIGIL